MFEYHTLETAPADSKPIMEAGQKAFGFVPMLHRVLAEAPAVYEAYTTNYSLFTEKTSFSATEQQIVMMAANFINECHYCMAGHTGLMKMQGVPDDVIASLRSGTPIADAKLEALRVFTAGLVERRGHIGDEALKTFLDAGYTKAQALEVMIGLAAKTISNFTNALAHTEIDEPMKQFAWSADDPK